MKTFISFFCVWILAIFLTPQMTRAAQYQCEVMTVSGSAEVYKKADQKAQVLKQGDLLSEGDVIQVGADSHVDVAFDGQWKNAIRLQAHTKAQIKSVYPGAVYLSQGHLFARLKQLPSKSTFEVETPVAVAAVRGSAYDTSHENGQTDVSNLHDSPVEVFAKDENGNLIEDGVVLSEFEKTEINDADNKPSDPSKMSQQEIDNKTSQLNDVDANDDSGASNIQDVSDIEMDQKETQDGENDPIENTLEKLDANQDMTDKQDKDQDRHDDNGGNGDDSDDKGDGKGGDGDNGGGDKGGGDGSDGDKGGNSGGSTGGDGAPPGFSV